MAENEDSLRADVDAGLQGRDAALLSPGDVAGLLSMARALAGAMEHAGISEIAAGEARRLTGAARAAVWELRDDGALYLVAESSSVPRKARRVGESVARLSSPEWDALRTHEPVWIPSRAEASERYPGVRLDPVGAATPCDTWAFLPSIVEAQAAGVLAFAFGKPRELDARARAFLGEIAAESANALARGSLFTRERARADTAEAARAVLDERFRRSEDLVSERTRLYERERFARGRAESDAASARQATDEVDRAQKILAALAAAGSARQAWVTLATHVAEAFRASGWTVTRRVGTELEVVQTMGFSSEVSPAGSRLPTDGSTPEGDVVRSGAPLWLESREEIARRYPRVAETLLRVGSAAWLGVPIPSPEGIAGTLAIAFRATRTFSATERANLVRLAVQCAAALHRDGAPDVQPLAPEASRPAGAEPEPQEDQLAAALDALRAPLRDIVLGVKRLGRAALAPTELRVLESLRASVDRMTAALPDPATQHAPRG